MVECRNFTLYKIIQEIKNLAIDDADYDFVKNEMIRQAKLGINISEMSIKRRECLVCGEMFLSVHKYNRVCRNCKQTNSWNNGV